MIKQTHLSFSNGRGSLMGRPHCCALTSYPCLHWGPCFPLAAPSWWLWVAGTQRQVCSLEIRDSSDGNIGSRATRWPCCALLELNCRVRLHHQPSHLPSLLPSQHLHRHGNLTSWPQGSSSFSLISIFPKKFPGILIPLGIYALCLEGPSLTPSGRALSMSEG